ncbi:GNAT family N-acetyltransferase [Sphingobacteriaceae bacterium]|nr:GNAT family N-acetyltransferase [Sphingobacteriaceae bacterium]
MLIRLATLSDIPEIMVMVRELVPLMNASGNFQWDDHYPNPEKFSDDVVHDKLWVAVMHEKIVGVSAITTDQDPEYAQVGWDLSEVAIVTHRLAVSIHHRGKGIAEALLQKAEDEAIRRNIKTLRVDTNSMNTATQKLFPKMGYTFAGEIDLSYRPNLRFYCYEKRLG